MPGCVAVAARPVPVTFVKVMLTGLEVFVEVKAMPPAADSTW